MITETGNNPKQTSAAAMLKDTLFHTTAHFSNDFFLSFFAPTLPVLITQMGLLKVQAGILNLSLELTALFMPLIGRLADRKDIRKFMVFTPLITALCMSMLGVIPNFYLLFLVLTIGGVSIYFYHAIGPADIAKVNQAALGRLMAIWNIAGQIAFMIGPLVVTAVITRWSVRQMPWLALLGGAATLALILIRKKPAGYPFKAAAQSELTLRSIQIRGNGSSDSSCRSQRSLWQFLSLTHVRTLTCQSILLNGAPACGCQDWRSRFTLALVLLGNYIGGLLHDRIGAKWVSAISLAGFAVFFTGTIFSTGILQLALITLMGVFSFMLMPAMMAMLQENNPEDRSLTNGLFLGLNYGVIALAGVAAGYMLDRMPTPTVFLISAALALSALAFVPWLKDESRQKKA